MLILCSTYSDEREKNRQRKLSAACSREWDSTKTEEDYNPKNKSTRFRRGVHGAVTGSPRGASTGPRRSVTSSGGSPKNPTSTQEWPDLPAATKDKLSTKDSLSVGDGVLVGGFIASDLPTNGKLAARGEPEAEDKASEKRKLDTNDGGVGDALAPLSPGVDGSSWAEQVEANTQ